LIINARKEHSKKQQTEQKHEEKLLITKNQGQKSEATQKPETGHEEKLLITKNQLQKPETASEYPPTESSHTMQEAKLNPKELKQHEKVHPKEPS